MKKHPDSYSTLLEFVMQIRPDLTVDQAVAAMMVLHEQCECYLVKGEGHPSIMQAIYVADLTDEEFEAYRNLSFKQQTALYTGQVQSATASTVC